MLFGERLNVIMGVLPTRVSSWGSYTQHSCRSIRASVGISQLPSGTSQDHHINPVFHICWHWGPKSVALGTGAILVERRIVANGSGTNWQNAWISKFSSSSKHCSTCATSSDMTPIRNPSLDLFTFSPSRTAGTRDVALKRSRRNCVIHISANCCTRSANRSVILENFILRTIPKHTWVSWMAPAFSSWDVGPISQKSRLPVIPGPEPGKPDCEQSLATVPTSLFMSFFLIDRGNFHKWIGLPDMHTRPTFSTLGSKIQTGGLKGGCVRFLISFSWLWSS